MIEPNREQVTAKKIGELLIEMGFITEDQLKEALALAKKKNIMAGVAMVEMGIISRDLVYWILGTQLNMSYIEVQPDTIDAELVHQFRLDDLRRLKCIPLYEEKGEIHFAVANPKDTDLIGWLSQARPSKTVMLNLALPDKIDEALDFFAESAGILPAPASMAPKPAPAQAGLPDAPPGDGMVIERDLEELTEALNPREILWIELMGGGWQAFASSGEGTRPQSLWRRGEPARIIQWLELQKSRSALHDPPGSAMIRWGQVAGLTNHLIWVKRLAAFDREDFLKSEPGAEAMTSSLRAHLERHRRVLIGAPDPSLAKRCWFASLPAPQPRQWARPIAIELQIDDVDRGVTQLEDAGRDIREALRLFSPALQPPMLLEIDPRHWDRERLELAPLLEMSSSQLAVVMRAAGARDFETSAAALPEPWRGYEPLFLGAEPGKSSKKSAK